MTEDPIARLVEATVAAREAGRALHEATRDAQAASRDAQAARQALQEASRKFTRDSEAVIAEAVMQLKATLDLSFEKYAEIVTSAVREANGNVERRAAELAGLKGPEEFLEDVVTTLMRLILPQIERILDIRLAKRRKGPQKRRRAG